MTRTAQAERRKRVFHCWADGLHAKEIAYRFNLDVRSVQRIIARERWERERYKWKVGGYYRG